MKPLLVFNFAAHYRVPLFEILQRELGMEIIFFSRGDEEYWQRHLGVSEGRYRSETIVGREILPKIRVNPGLAKALLTREYDVLIKCINGRLEVPLAYAVAKLRRKPFILWTEIWSHPTTGFHRVTRPLVRYIYRHADAIIASGENIARHVIAQGAEADKVFVAELAIDNDFFCEDPSTAEAEGFRSAAGAADRPLVLAVARLSPEKGVDVLIEAAAQLRDLRPVVVVVGTGKLEADMRRLAERLDVDLYLAGGLKPEQMPAVYRAADVLAMPSVTTPLIKEVWGLAANEAMCSGVPVVASDAVGAAAGGLVRDGVTGLVVPERDATALAAALRRILTSPSLAGELVENARERVASTTFAAMAESFRAALAYAVSGSSAERAGRS